MPENKGISRDILVGVITAAIIGAGAFIVDKISKGGIVKLVGGTTREDVDDMIAKAVAQIDLPSGPASLFPTGAVVAFDGGSYEKQTGERLESGCPSGWVRFVQAEGRFLLGSDSYPSTGEAGEYDLRETGGEKEHALLAAEIPLHSHDVPFVPEVSNLSGAGYAVMSDLRHQSTARSVVTTTPYGGPPNSQDGVSSPHNNMPPYVALYFCKKVVNRPPF